jgi:hypothetical protein
MFVTKQIVSNKDIHRNEIGQKRAIYMTEVEIDNFQSNYLIQRRERNHDGIIKEKLDAIANHFLDQECSRVLSRTLSSNDSQIFIKDLKISFHLNTAQLDDKAIANLWANEMSSAILNAVANPAYSNNIVRFPNISEYLASFIIDLTRGVAWQKWYYQGLKHLGKFDNRGLIKELLSQNREIIEDILLLLAEKDSLGEFLRELREEDIEIIYDDYLDTYERHSSRSFKDLVAILSESLNENAFNLPGEQFCSFKNYLSIYLRTIQRYPELKSVASMRKAVRLTFLLMELFGRYESTGVLGGFVEQGNIDGFLSFVQAERNRELLVLQVLTKEVIKSEGRKALLDIAKFVKEKTETISTRKIVTPYGGIFLLIRTLLEVNLHLIIEGSSFPERKNLPKTKAFLLFLCQKIAGHEALRCDGIDMGILLFAGFRNHPVPSLLREYTEKVTPEMNREFLESVKTACPQSVETFNRNVPEKHADIDFESTLDITKKLIYKTFSSRLKKFEKSSPEYIFENFLHRPSEIILDGDILHIKLSKKPLDVVLRLSGLLEIIRGVPWLDNRSIEFELER